MFFGIVPVYLKCKKCGALYLFNPCGLTFEPLSIKAVIGYIKGIFDLVFRSKYSGVLSGECPYCGGELEKAGYH